MWLFKPPTKPRATKLWPGKKRAKNKQKRRLCRRARTPAGTTNAAYRRRRPSRGHPRRAVAAATVPPLGPLLSSSHAQNHHREGRQLRRLPDWLEPHQRHRRASTHLLPLSSRKPPAPPAHCTRARPRPRCDGGAPTPPPSRVEPPRPISDRASWRAALLARTRSEGRHERHGNMVLDASLTPPRGTSNDGIGLGCVGERHHLFGRSTAAGRQRRKPYRGSRRWRG